MKGSKYYLSDIALEAGIKMFWTRIPNDIGKETNWGRWGFTSTLIPEKLPDGKKVWGFMRYYEDGQTNNTYLGACINRVLYGDKFSGNKPMQPDTYEIISTHLGYSDMDGKMDNKYIIADDVYNFNHGKWFNDDTVQAFKKFEKGTRFREDFGYKDF
ncbi:hypothetical protein SD70_15795 [Gordoniibacillus kamchatkensis]|uniref:Uncharacterized protein n=2 Tax=Gordoniibacillus kamchatkensis TaxID=1590651 RepID=A0ABR5AHS5_9BACL|nr:hypothetical protein SD70_15795 [Paenibacillus sp. VKM B-2647]